MLERLIRNFRSRTERQDEPTPETIAAWRHISQAWVGLAVAYTELYIASGGNHPEPERIEQIMDQARVWNSIADEADRASRN